MKSNVKSQINIFNREIKNKSLPKTIKNKNRFSPKRHTHLQEESYVYNNIPLIFNKLIYLHYNLVK